MNPKSKANESNNLPILAVFAFSLFKMSFIRSQRLLTQTHKHTVHPVRITDFIISAFGSYSTAVAADVLLDHDDIHRIHSLHFVQLVPRARRNQQPGPGWFVFMRAQQDEMCQSCGTDGE